MRSVNLKIAGMSCGLCVKSIEGALREIGVKGTVNLASATATVEVDDNELSLEKIKEAIENQGFKLV